MDEVNDGSSEVEVDDTSGASPASPESGSPSRPNPGPQQAVQQPSQSSNADKCKNIQQQLVLLIHAHKCQRRETQAMEQEVPFNAGCCSFCNVFSRYLVNYANTLLTELLNNARFIQITRRTCQYPNKLQKEPQPRTMKDVLNHMTTCLVNRTCTVQHCSSSKQILAHWQLCINTTCPVCLPLRQAIEDRNFARIGVKEIGSGSSSAPTKSSAPVKPTPLIKPVTWKCQFSNANPEKIRLIQQQIVLLTHAQRCKRREGQANGGDVPARACTLPHCRTMKNVLSHMTMCSRGMSCIAPHCAPSRQIITHWKHCTHAICPVCVPLREAMNCRNYPNDGSSGATREGRSGSVSSSARRLSHASIRSTPEPQLDSSTLQLPDGLNANHLTANPMPETKEWHRSITPDIRDQHVLKLIKSVLPTVNPNALRDRRLMNLVGYAKNVEGDIYESANSRSEYYHLIAKNMYETEKKRQKIKLLLERARKQEE